MFVHSGASHHAFSGRAHWECSWVSLWIKSCRLLGWGPSRDTSVEPPSNLAADSMFGLKCFGSSKATPEHTPDLCSEDINCLMNLKDISRFEKLLFFCLFCLILLLLFQMRLVFEILVSSYATSYILFSFCSLSVAADYCIVACVVISLQLNNLKWAELESYYIKNQQLLLPPSTFLLSCYATTSSNWFQFLRLDG